MLTRNITKLPGVFQTEPVLQYYLILREKRGYLWFKRGLDILISLLLLLILSPLLLLTALLVKCTSRGPVFYRQERVGKNGKSFWILKFRTMVKNADHMGAPITVGNRDSRITVIGHVLRASRIDEFPQFINVLKGDMSIIGPRPALWNQYDLIEERDRYGANDILPGLTGWAQINGRDELEIDVKARLDGEYVERMSFLFDCKCFFGTITSVLKHEGVVEGGTGELKKEVQS